MQIRKVIRRTVDESTGAGNVAADLHVAVAANVNEPGRTRSSVSTRQRIVQRSVRRTETDEEGTAR